MGVTHFSSSLHHFLCCPHRRGPRERSSLDSQPYGPGDVVRKLRQLGTTRLAQVIAANPSRTAQADGPVDSMLAESQPASDHNRGSPDRDSARSALPFTQ